MGGDKGWAAVNTSSPSEPSPVLSGTPWSITTAKSSRRGNERMRLIIGEGGREIVATRRDFMTGENPWNGTKGTAGWSKPQSGS